MNVIKLLTCSSSSGLKGFSWVILLKEYSLIPGGTGKVILLPELESCSFSVLLTTGERALANKLVTPIKKQVKNSYICFKITVVTTLNKVSYISFLNNADTCTVCFTKVELANQC